MHYSLDVNLTAHYRTCHTPARGASFVTGQSVHVDGGWLLH
ncbi:hypothetical protein ACFU8I_30705 [Streptomyces sp. NPDC057540]